MSDQVKFTLWNTAGKLAWRVGKASHALGLSLCGVSGTFDAIADRYR